MRDLSHWRRLCFLFFLVRPVIERHTSFHPLCHSSPSLPPSSRLHLRLEKKCVCGLTLSGVLAPRGASGQTAEARTLGRGESEGGKKSREFRSLSHYARYAAYHVAQSPSLMLMCCCLRCRRVGGGWKFTILDNSKGFLSFSCFTHSQIEGEAGLVSGFTHFI